MGGRSGCGKRTTSLGERRRTKESVISLTLELFQSLLLALLTHNVMRSLSQICMFIMGMGWVVQLNTGA